MIAAAPLVNLTSNVSQSPEGSTRRTGKIELREALWEHSTVKRVRGCGRRRIDASAPVSVRVAAGVAHYANVQLCGAVHLCPVCSARIRQERAGEIERGLLVHLRELHWGDGKACEIGNRGGHGSAEFLTLTLPHDQGDKLPLLLEAVADGFRSVLAGRAWAGDPKRGEAGERERFGVVGVIRAHETTNGRNGWHPHLHVLLLTARVLSEEERAELLAAMYRRWAAAVERAGYRRPLPGLCTMEPVRSPADVAGYVNKFVLVPESGRPDKVRRVGLEMARHDLKQGRTSGSRGEGAALHRTPFQILHDFAASGDCDDLALWHAWEQGSAGHKALTWSPGLKRLLGVADRTDDDITAEEIGGEDVCAIGAEEWQAVIRTRGATARVLELAEINGADAVAVYVAGVWARWAAARRLVAPP